MNLPRELAAKKKGGGGLVLGCKIAGVCGGLHLDSGSIHDGFRAGVAIAALAGRSPVIAGCIGFALGRKGAAEIDDEPVNETNPEPPQMPPLPRRLDSRRWDRLGVGITY